LAEALAVGAVDDIEARCKIMAPWVPAGFEERDLIVARPQGWSQRAGLRGGVDLGETPGLS